MVSATPLIYKSEDVLAVCGRVLNRPDGMENTNLPTGRVEILVTRYEVLSHSETLPFQIGRIFAKNQ